MSVTTQDKQVVDVRGAKERLQAIASATVVESLVSASGGAKLYLIGGVVRDSLLGRTSADTDIAIDISADECLHRLSQAGVKVYTTGLKHDTLTAVPVDGEPPVEITSFRNNARTVEDDLRARDFTINAIAYDLQSRHIIDPLGGVSDLEKGIVRACGSAHERFSEDSLRILRMVRFSCSLNFAVDSDTYKVAKDYLADNDILTVSIERIREELNRILVSNHPVMGIRMLAELGVLKTILPEIHAFMGYEQNDYHKHDLYNHTLEVIQNTVRFEPTCDKTDETENRYSTLILRLSALLHDVGKPPSLSVDAIGRRHFYCHEVIGLDVAKKILNRFKYPNEVRQAVLMLIKTHMRPINGGDGSLRRILRDTGDYYQQWRQLKEADSLGCKTDEQEAVQILAQFDARMARIQEEQTASQFRLALNGRDIIALGFKEGPQVGKIIRKLTDMVLDNPELNTKEQLTEIIQRLYKK